MLKSKLYSGTFTKQTTTKTVKRVPETTTVSCNIEKTNILCNALLDFLEECGCEVSYEEESLVIYICGAPVIFVFSGSNLYYSNIYSGSVTIATISGSSYTPYTTLFNNDGTYKFNLKLIGEPTGCFTIVITSYDITYNQSYNYLSFVNLENILDNEEYVGINLGSKSDFNLFKKNPLKYFPNVSSTSYGKILFKDGYDMSVEELSISGNQGKYPIIQMFLGPYKVINCYYLMKTNELNVFSYPGYSGGYFYEIDGDIYMTFGKLFLVKCVTQ